MSTSKKTVNYQRLYQELEDILKQLQVGELDIDQAVKAHERGMFILDQLRKYIEETDNKVKKIKANFA